MGHSVFDIKELISLFTKDQKKTTELVETYFSIIAKDTGMLNNRRNPRLRRENIEEIKERVSVQFNQFSDLTIRKHINSMKLLFVKKVSPTKRLLWSVTRITIREDS